MQTTLKGRDKRTIFELQRRINALSKYIDTIVTNAENIEQTALLDTLIRVSASASCVINLCDKGINNIEDNN